MNNVGQILIAVAILVVAVVGFMASGRFAGLKQQEIRNEAMYQCAMSSKYEVTDAGGATVSYPVEELYNKCLSAKNVN